MTNETIINGKKYATNDYEEGCLCGQEEMA